MADSFLKITDKFDFRKLSALNKTMFDNALEKGAIQMLDWSAIGSSKVPETPPIRQGILKGSGSVFVGNKLIKTTSRFNVGGSKKTTPNRDYSGKESTITIGYNTDYAAEMHENSELNPGPFSVQAGNSNPGNQWLFKHLAGDGELLMDTIGRMMKSELNK